MKVKADLIKEAWMDKVFWRMGFFKAYLIICATFHTIYFMEENIKKLQ